MVKNYHWIKGYKYVNVPVHFRRFIVFGWAITFQSVATKRRRVGAKRTDNEVYKLYEDLLTPKND